MSTGAGAGRPRWATFDGTAWTDRGYLSEDRPVSRTSLVAYKDDLYHLYLTGKPGRSYLSWNCYQSGPEKWRGAELVKIEHHSVPSTGVMAAAHTNGYIYVVYSGGTTGKLTYTRYERQTRGTTGGKWDEPRLVFFPDQSEAVDCVDVSVAVYAGSLWCVFRGSGDQCLLTRHNTTELTWSAPVPVPMCEDGSTPSLTPFDGKLRSAWRQTKNSTTLLSGYDETSWEAGSLMLDQDGNATTSADTPVISASNDWLYCVGTPAEGPGFLWTRYHPTGPWWSTPQLHTPEDPVTRPVAALAPYSGLLHCVYHGQ